MTTEDKKPRGFAAIKLKNPELVSEMARAGGKAAHAKGTAHQFTSEEARIAGRKGGTTTHARRRAAQATEFNEAAREAMAALDSDDKSVRDDAQLELDRLSNESVPTPGHDRN